MICPSCGGENEDGAERCRSCEAVLVHSGTLRPGTLVAGRYQIQELLGGGGMGVVYKAHDRLLEETVALKVLRAELASSGLARRFREEIRLARRVTHRNVCRIHEYGEERDLRYISMAFLDGVDLKRILRDRGPLEPSEAIDVARAVAGGLQAIHDEGIVHRDLKPANIMRDRTGVVRIMDFGIAKDWSASAGSGLTAVGMIVGTPEYMSPEQATGSHVDSRSDLYSLGIVLYELFTGRVPFQGDTPMATLFRHVHEPVRLDSPEASPIPPEVRPLLARALSKSPRERFASAREMGEALARTQRSQALGAPAPVLTAAIPEPAPRLGPPAPTQVHTSTAPGLAPTQAVSRTTPGQTAPGVTRAPSPAPRIDGVSPAARPTRQAAGPPPKLAPVPHRAAAPLAGRVQPSQRPVLPTLSVVAVLLLASAGVVAWLVTKGPSGPQAVSELTATQPAEAAKPIPVLEESVVASSPSATKTQDVMSGPVKPPSAVRQETRPASAAPRQSVEPSRARQTVSPPPANVSTRPPSGAVASPVAAPPPADGMAAAAETAWNAVRRVAEDTARPEAERTAALRKFLDEVTAAHPHRAEAERLLGRLEEEERRRLLRPPDRASLGRLRKAIYVGGSLEGLTEGTQGSISFPDRERMVFLIPGGGRLLVVPFRGVSSIEYGLTNTIRGLVFKKKSHYMSLTYRDAKGESQGMVLELDKDDFRPVLTLLEARTGKQVQYQDEQAAKTRWK